MYFLIFGAVLFFIPHLYSVFRKRKTPNNTRVNMGEPKFLAIYGSLSILGLVLMIWGYGLARPSPIIYNPPDWGRHVTMAFMLVSMILLFAAYGPRGYIKNTIRHPMTISVVLWAIGHLLANGELNSLILFGSFLVYGLLALFSAFKRYIQYKKPSIFGDLYAIIVGLGIYYVLVFHLHELLFSVAIIPS